MIDVEVSRLRKLRDAALRARTLAEALRSRDPRHAALFCQSSLLCWGISRIATGRLRAHPYRRYHQGPGHIGPVIDRWGAAVTALFAARRSRTLQTFAAELALLARELDDTRALTWLPDLSDALGRAQVQMRRILQQTEFASGGKSVPEVSTSSDDFGVAESTQATRVTWPYLAI